MESKSNGGILSLVIQDYHDTKTGELIVSSSKSMELFKEVGFTEVANISAPYPLGSKKSGLVKIKPYGMEANDRDIWVLKKPEDWEPEPDFSSRIQSKAEEIVRDPRYLSIVKGVLGKHIVGEDINKLRIFLAALARRRRAEWMLLTGPSRGGKDYVAENTLDLFPKDDYMKVKRFSDKVLDYLSQWRNDDGVVDLDGKIIFIPESEFSTGAMRQLRPMYGKKGEIYSTQVVKDQEAKRMPTKGCPVVVSGAVAPEQDFCDQDLNRFTLLSISEREQQTKDVHKKQREERRIPWEYEKGDKWKVLQAITRLYEDDIGVIIPFSDYLTFPTKLPKFRGLHEEFLNLIEIIAYAHRFQRPVVKKDGKKYIFASFGDLYLAVELYTKSFTGTVKNLSPGVEKLYSRLLHTFDLGEEFDYDQATTLTKLSKQTVRNYLNSIHDQNLAEKEKRGKKAYYTLNQPMEEFKDITISNFNTILKSFTPEKIETFIREHNLHSNLQAGGIHDILFAPFINPFNNTTLIPLTENQNESYVQEATKLPSSKVEKGEDILKLHKVMKVTSFNFQREDDQQEEM